MILFKYVYKTQSMA